MVDLIPILGVVSVVSVMLPGVVLPIGFRRLKPGPLRNLTILLSAFGLVHGVYHILLLLGMFSDAVVVDFVTVLLLVALGWYYMEKVG